ncbi:MAG: type I-C CRISPR-associated protein Cas8c/Csd1 [Desulfovibrionaceae bacterium]|nr:type I-C CRISPR-associated protein Cas8c/Csd1 [Desulfovibrionaceae bacterium]
MSWMQKLYETYEACYGNDNVPNAGEIMPISHTSLQAHIQVTIDQDGNFVRAELLPNKESVIIPATEDSAGRTGKKPPPHPLDDKIRYCAKDYEGSNTEFEQYLALLKDWCASPQSHPMVEAVLKYVEKGTLVHDLVKCGILLADDKGKLLTSSPPSARGAEKKDTIFDRLPAKKLQGEAVVAWSVLSPGELEPKTWLNTQVQRAWVDYDVTKMQKKALCMVNGFESGITTKHPRNIRHPGDGAKLISSNDDKNYTFRGRFVKPEEACTVSYEASQKAHNALRWLIQRQGYRNGEQVVLAWAVSGVPLPNPCDNFFDPSDDKSLADEFSDDAAEAESGNSVSLDMGQSFALRLDKAIRGYRAELSDTEGIVIMAMDAASPGRLSITFYREQYCKEYLTNLIAWQEHCAWPQPIVATKVSGKKSGHTVWIPFAPLPKNIALAAYGKRCDDKLLKATVERLLPCIVDALTPPRDLVESCVRRACNRAALDGWEWNNVLCVACALYKCFRFRKDKTEYDMALDESSTSRDYLYGRLLAVAEYIERTALNEAEEKRPTNAERLMQRFADHPYATWRQLELALQPYMQRLQSSKSSGLLFRAKKTIDTIMDLFESGDFVSSAPLSGEFLLGFHCQCTAMYAKKEK